MDLLVNVLLWIHFVGLAMAVGGGIALGVVGPKLVAALASEREDLWALERTFDVIGAAGLVVLVITGPLMWWLRFGAAGLGPWFEAKMFFVILAVAGVVIHQAAGKRFRRGGENAVWWMYLGGRVAGAAMVLAAGCAVMTFN